MAYLEIWNQMLIQRLLIKLLKLVIVKLNQAFRPSLNNCTTTALASVPGGQAADRVHDHMQRQSLLRCLRGPYYQRPIGSSPFHHW